MPSLILPRRFARQPGIIEISPDFLAFEPISVIDFSRGALDLVSGNFATRVGSGAFETIATPNGPGLRFGDSSGGTYLSIPIPSPLIGSNDVDSMSMVWQGSLPSTGTQTAARDWTSSGGSLLVWKNSGFDLRLGNIDYTAAGTFSHDQQYTTVLAHSKNDTGYWVGGVGRVITGTAGVGSATSPIVLHRNGNTTQGLNATTSQFALFAKRFPNDVALSLSNDPRQMFRAKPQVLYFDVGGGGGPTYTLSLGTGSFSSSGQAIGLRAARKLSLSAGSFTESGIAVGLRAGRKLPLGVGSLSLSGQALSLRASRKLPLGAGAFSLTGQAVDLTYTPLSGPTYTLALGTGNFSLSGQTLGLRAARKLGIGAGAFALSGQSVGLYRQFRMALSPGAFTLAGQNLSLTAHRALALSTGVFTLSGQSVGMTPTVALDLSDATIAAIADAVWAHPNALTLQKFLALK